MKVLLISLLLSSGLLAKTAVLKGKVDSNKGCSNKTMVWVSLDKDNYQDRILLMHTEVPVGGTFQVHLKPGQYQVRASDKVGCEAMRRISVKEGEQSIQIKLENK